MIAVLFRRSTRPAILGAICLVVERKQLLQCEESPWNHRAFRRPPVILRILSAATRVPRRWRGHRRHSAERPPAQDAEQHGSLPGVPVEATAPYGDLPTVWRSISCSEAMTYMSWDPFKESVFTYQYHATRSHILGSTTGLVSGSVPMYELPKPEDDHGWMKMDGFLEPVWSRGPIRPPSLVDLLDTPEEEQEENEEEAGVYDYEELLDYLDDD